MRHEIEAANKIFVAAFGRGDATGLAALYTADGQLLPTNSDVVSGTSAILAFWQGVIDMGLSAATLETLEVEDCGDTAVENRAVHAVDWGRHRGGFREICRGLEEARRWLEVAPRHLEHESPRGVLGVATRSPSAPCDDVTECSTSRGP